MLRRLREYATRQLGSRPEVRKVVLFGSLAKGTWSGRSDADLAVLIDETDRSARERIPSYLPERPLPVPVDVFVYTPAEARWWRPRFRAEIAGGIVLYHRERDSG